MKKFMMLAAAVLTLGICAANAANDRKIDANQLPAKAQQFIAKYFPDSKTAYAKEEHGKNRTTYEVVFTDGKEIEFRADGEWKEVDCKWDAVPAGIVPQQITRYVAQNYPDAVIRKIEHGRHDYEIELDNGTDLTFDLQFNLTKIDD